MAWKLSAKKPPHRHYKTLNEVAIAVAGKAIAYDTYISCGLPRFEPVRDRRARADEVSIVPGFWLDIDFGKAGHGSGLYPPTIEEAYQLLDIAPKPTLVVESGHGLQVWWLFDNPYRITNGASRERFVNTFASLHNEVALAAKSHGWSLDSTRDLARLFRPAGTLNHKVPGDVKSVVLAVDDGQRWSLDEIEGELGYKHQSKLVEPTPLATKAKPVHEPTNIPWGALNASPVARQLLAGEAMGYDSPSERDAALAKIAVNHGADIEDVRSLVYARRKAADENPAKAFRPDYMHLTYEFVQSTGDELPASPDKRLLEWFGEVLPSIAMNENHSVIKIVTHMVKNARGARFLGTRGSIENELGYDPKTVTTAWKRLKELGFIKPINPKPYEGLAKGWIFLLPTPSNN